MSTPMTFTMTTAEAPAVFAKLRGERLSTEYYATVAAVLRRWQGSYTRATAPAKAER